MANVKISDLTTQTVAGSTLFELELTGGGSSGKTTAANMRVGVNQGSSALTSGVTVNTDCSLNNVFTLSLAHNATLANPTNKATGATYLWIVAQTAGSNTLSYGTDFTWPGGAAPTLSTAAGAVDVICAVYDGTKLRANINKTFS